MITMLEDKKTGERFIVEGNSYDALQKLTKFLYDEDKGQTIVDRKALEDDYDVVILTLLAPGIFQEREKL